MTEPYGEEALNAFNRAAKSVKEGRYEEALKEELSSSDRVVIVRRIAKREMQKSENAT